MRRAALVLAWAAVLGAPAPVRAETTTVLDDGWYALHLGGAKAGWVHQVTRRHGDGDTARYESEMTMYLAMLRGGAKIEIEQSQHMVEDASGRVMRVATRTKMGATESAKEIVVAGDSMTITEGRHEREAPYPKDALGTFAAQRLAERLVADGSRDLTVKIFSPDAPERAHPMKVRIGEKERVNVNGIERELLAVTTVLTLSGFEVGTATWVDPESYEVVVSETTVPMLGKMRQTRTTKALAQMDVEPSEVFASSFVSPDRAIAGPRELRRATFRLRSTSEKVPLGVVPDGVGQTATVEEDGAVVVTIDTAVPEAARSHALPLEVPEELRPELRANPWLEIDDERIVALAKRAVEGKTTAYDAARAIEAFVDEYIDQKSFGVAFATAAETARDRQGDCTEHGVLAAALARAAGLPSRVAIGCAYVGAEAAGALPEAEKFPRGIFAFHLWTEVWVGDRWIAIDAAMGAMDATHIALARTNLNEDGVTDSVIGLLSFMGNLSIEVIEPR